MGVIYKLTEDVVHFILEEKKSIPDLSCRQLVERIGTHFRRDVSKSSVHEVLKQAHIVSPRGRKAKNKFQIPAEKKAQLLASLPPGLLRPPVAPSPAAREDRPTLLPDPVLPPFAAIEKTLPLMPALPEGPLMENMGEIFLEAAFRELFPQPWGGNKGVNDFKIMKIKDLQEEMNYRNLMATHIKVELEDNSAFYIDVRFQQLTAQPQPIAFPAPIERALTDMADFLLNNTQILVIKEFKEEYLWASFVDFWSAFSHKPGKKISRMSLIGDHGVLAEFGDILAPENGFLIGINTQNIDIKYLMSISPSEIRFAPSHSYPSPLRYVSKAFSKGGLQARLLILLSENNAPQQVLLGVAADAVSDADLVRAYAQRHPAGQRFPVFSVEKQLLAQNGEDLLKSYAGQFFPQAPTADEWDAILKCKGTLQQGDKLSIINVNIADTYNKSSDLVQAMDAVNALGIRDEAGRNLWLRPKTGQFYPDVG